MFLNFDNRILKEQIAKYAHAFYNKTLKLNIKKKKKKFL